MLGVQASTLESHGAVSESVVAEMATGALRIATANLAVAVSGVAGPGGGSVEKPVGMVCFAWASPFSVQTETCYFGGDRAAVRSQTIEHALAGLLARIPLD